MDTTNRRPFPLPFFDSSRSRQGESMPHTCTKCSRVNPDDAQYCYFDGVLLNGTSSKPGAPARAAPAAVGSLQGFSQPFVFPNGAQCRNFDQLAVACQQNWS